MFNFFNKPASGATESVLIAGLGNPGREYRNNRHNIGFMAVDVLAERLDVKFTRMESQALVAKGQHGATRLILAKPQTYMNLSGQAIGALQRFYKVPLDRLLVIYDDVDLPFGVLRLRPKGGSAGQKGMKSIIERLGTQDFPRLRLGIGRPPGRMQTPDFVLQDFGPGDQADLKDILSRAAEAALVFTSDGLNTAMNQFNPANGKED